MWSALGKYRSIVISIALFLILDASVLILNFYISFKIADDAVGVNLAGRQRMLSQRTVKSLYEIAAYGDDFERLDKAEKELSNTFNLFNKTLYAFDVGGDTKGANGEAVILKPVESEKGRAAIEEAKKIWSPYKDAIQLMLAESDPNKKVEYLAEATQYAKDLNLSMLKLMNNLTVDLENVATQQAKTLRYVQTAGITLAIINFLIILFHFIGELRGNDRKLEAARRETTEILNTVNEGLFLLDKDLHLGSQHSARLSEMFGGKEVENVSFSDLIGDLIKPKDLETAQRFVSLLFRSNVKTNLIKDLNPLNEVELTIPDGSGGYVTRYLNFDFSRVDQNDAPEAVLVTVNDVTRSVLLAAELAAEKEKGEQQMAVLTSLLHTDPKTLKRFIQSGFDSYGKINEYLKLQTNNTVALQKKIDNIFIEVHNLKGDASALELDKFTSLAHDFESDIVSLRGQENVSGNDFLRLTVHLESMIRYTESVQEIAEKLASFSTLSGGKRKGKADSDFKWDHLKKLCEKVAERENKKAHLLLTGFDETDVDEEIASFVNDVTIQFVRNSIVHSIENPEVRSERKKSNFGRIDARLLYLPSGELELSVRDDGAGINYEKIRAHAMNDGRWNPKEVAKWGNKQLLPLIFETGFSTASTATEDAGRGFGMDVIRSRVNAMKGRMKVSSRSGIDCQFTILLPMKAKNAKKTMAA